MMQPSGRRHVHFMATPIPIPPAGGPADPARPLLSYIPVFEVVVGTAVLLAASGVIIAIVAALRRRRALVTAWVLSASAFSLAFIVWVLWALHEFT
jgi:heme/copper-type cytochrome/quinol oxidase subunit 3